MERRALRETALFHSEIQPEKRLLIKERTLQCHILPRWSSAGGDGGLYAGCYTLLDDTFAAQSRVIRAAAYSTTSLAQSWEASRAACLVLEGKVVTALTYRATRSSLYGTAIMVRPLAPAVVAALHCSSAASWGRRAAERALPLLRAAGAVPGHRARHAQAGPGAAAAGARAALGQLPGHAGASEPRRLGPSVVLGHTSPPALAWHWPRAARRCALCPPDAVDFSADA
jgi:hypothetical protein